VAPSCPGRSVTLAGGLTTVVTEVGADNGSPPVVLLHGWVGSRRSFAALTPVLSRHARLVAADQRGHGNADKPTTGYDLPTLAGDVLSLLDLLELPRVVLLGASSGGYVAQQVALDAPDRVAGLVLAGTPRDLRGRPPFADELDRLHDPVDPAWARSFTAGLTDLDRLPSWYVDVLVEDSLRLPAAIWRASLHGLITSAPPTDLGVIDVPTLVVSGGRDHLVGEQTAALVAAIPGAQWIEYPDTGHLVLEEQPTRLADDVADFLAGIPADS
jgi:rifampin ADP-ribosylating transferase